MHGSVVVTDRIRPQLAEIDHRCSVTQWKYCLVDALILTSLESAEDEGQSGHDPLRGDLKRWVQSNLTVIYQSRAFEGTVGRDISMQL